MSDLKYIYRMIKNINTELSWEDFLDKLNDTPDYSIYALSTVFQNKSLDNFENI